MTCIDLNSSGTREIPWCFVILTDMSYEMIRVGAKEAESLCVCVFVFVCVCVCTCLYVCTWIKFGCVNV